MTAKKVSAAKAANKTVPENVAEETVRKDGPPRAEIVNTNERINRDPKTAAVKTETDMGDGTKRKDF